MKEWKEDYLPPTPGLEGFRETLNPKPQTLNPGEFVGLRSVVGFRVKGPDEFHGQTKQARNPTKPTLNPKP